MSGMLLDYTPPTHRCETDDGPLPLWQLELRDLARGLCGGLIVALPLLYTLEMWIRARYIPEFDLMIVLVLAYLVNVAACYFCGFKSRRRRIQPWFDALTALGVGAVAAALTLTLIGRLGLSIPPTVVINLVALELIPVSLGASLAMNQLGGGPCDETTIAWAGHDMRRLLATVVGAILFAFNVAPTIEPKIILTTITWWHTIAIAAFSLFVSWLMVDYAQFSQEDCPRDGIVFSGTWVETIFSYAISLAVSAAFLWMFGYIDIQTDVATALPWIVILGYATTLGGSAGRLIL